MIFALTEVQVSSNAIRTYQIVNSLQQLAVLFTLTYVQVRMNAIDTYESANNRE